MIRISIIRTFRIWLTHGRRRSMYSGVSNSHTVWNKLTGQIIFPKLINAQGYHSTVQYRANKHTG